MSCAGAGAALFGTLCAVSVGKRSALGVVKELGSQGRADSALPRSRGGPILRPHRALAHRPSPAHSQDTQPSRRQRSSPGQARQVVARGQSSRHSAPAACSRVRRRAHPRSRGRQQHVLNQAAPQRRHLCQHSHHIGHTHRRTARAAGSPRHRTTPVRRALSARVRAPASRLARELQWQRGVRRVEAQRARQEGGGLPAQPQQPPAQLVGARQQ